MDLKDKISQTKLFSDAQKVALLAELESLSSVDAQKLGVTIDNFNTQYDTLVKKLQKEVGEAIPSLSDDPQYKQAFADITSGIVALAS